MPDYSDTSASPAGSIPAYPWRQGPLDTWAICGMNHYHVDGERFLFVSMTKGGKCITAEGKDDKYLWNRLCHAAGELNALVMNRAHLRSDEL